jgi:hypothetical protein
VLADVIQILHRDNVTLGHLIRGFSRLRIALMDPALKKRLTEALRL